jgi:DNA-binding beta-propeller fold protein YncE
LPTELQVSPDGKRAFVHYGLQHRVATLDLDARKAVGSAKTGRGGKKFLGNMMGGLYGWAGMWAAGYSIWIRTGPSMLAVRPDGRYAYAINNQTKDITVVDGATGKSVEMIGGDGYSLELLKDGRFLFEVSGSELRLVDMERNVKAAEIALPNLRGLFFPPDRSVGVALARQKVLVLDGASGKELARLSDFVSPDAIVFETGR